MFMDVKRGIINNYINQWPNIEIVVQEMLIIVNATESMKDNEINIYK